jgi:hypothetical protein
MTRVSPGMSARAKGELAEQMVPVAAALACAVRGEETGDIEEILCPMGVLELRALVVVLAAMVPVDAPVGELLDWISWDEEGRPLPGSTPMLPQMPLNRAETRREYLRLRAEGLSLPAASRAVECSLRTAARYEALMYAEEAAA